MDTHPARDFSGMSDDQLYAELHRSVPTSPEPRTRVRRSEHSSASAQMVSGIIIAAVIAIIIAAGGIISFVIATKGLHLDFVATVVFMISGAGIVAFFIVLFAFMIWAHHKKH